MLTEQLASGQLHPWPSVGGLVVTRVITNKMKTLYHLQYLAKHLHTCTKTVQSPTQPRLLAQSAIITHSEWLWKVYSFLKSNKNNRVTITASDVAVSFHCVSSSSRLFPNDTTAENTAVWSSNVCVRGQNWKSHPARVKLSFYPDVININEPVEAKSRMSASCLSNQKYPITVSQCPAHPTSPYVCTGIPDQRKQRFPLTASELRSNGHGTLRSSVERVPGMTWYKTDSRCHTPSKWITLQATLYKTGALRWLHDMLSPKKCRLFLKPALHTQF